MVKFFEIPFANSGDKNSVPDPLQISGNVSYTTGWTPNYQLPYTNPAFLDVDRGATNQILYDITSALQIFQTHGAPDFILASATDAGTPWPYDINSIVRYDDGVNGARIFQSLINNNTNIPSSQTISQNFTVSGNTLILSSTTAYYTGASVTLKTSGSLPSPLNTTTTYYVININSTTISLATTLNNAINNVPITLSGSPSGTQTIIIFATWRWVDYSADKIVLENVVFQNSVAQGAAVAWDPTNNWFANAIADGSVLQQMVGIADVNFNRVYLSGYVPILSGLAPGAVYYLSTTTAGGLQTPANTSNVRVGIAKSATELWLNPIVFPLPYTLSVTINSAQTIAPNVITKILWDTINIDAQNIFNLTTSRAVATEAGYYVFSGLVNLQSTTVNNTVTAIFIYVNGVEILRGHGTQPIAQLGNMCSPTVFRPVFLNVGDYVELYMSHNDSSSLLCALGKLMDFSGYKLPA